MSSDSPPTTASAEDRHGPTPSPRGVTRRRFLKWLGVGAGAAVAGVAADALLIEPGWVKLTRPTISLPTLPPAWDGVRIAQLSDIHVGRLVSLEDARDAVDLANSLEPDVIVLTGDYVSRADAITRALVEVFRNLRAPEGVFAVLGNHDYWIHRDQMIRTIEQAGIDMLVNEHRILRRGRAELCLAGVDDYWSEDPGPDLAAALAGVPESACRILLAHNPDYVEDLTGTPRVDLALSGHTHGGQVNLPLLGPPVLPIRHRKYAAGLVAGPHCPVYVSRGLGMVEVPVRLNCRPELPLLTLRRG
jgi:uncharacterized protein